jgi:hypothetical protein
MTKASGWCLAIKLGHNPGTLSSIIEKNPQKKTLLIQGIGWGTSAVLFDQVSSGHPDRQTKKDDIINLFFEYPESYHHDLWGRNKVFI